MSVILYSTHCPRCNVLENKLKEKNVDFEEVNDVDLMVKKGIQIAPVLEVDGEIMEFGKATQWVNNL